MVHKPGPIAYTFALAAGIGIVLLGFLGVRTWDQAQEITELRDQLDARTLDLGSERRALARASSTITELQAELQGLRSDIETLADQYRDAQDQNDEFEDEIRDLARDIDEFERLNEIDEELLAKYSKVYFLNENYTPSRLVEIDEDYVLDRPDIADEYFHADAYEFLERMLRRAERDGHDLQVVSAYRSFDEQQELKTMFTQVYGEGANTFSADQGYSEHQLGTTVDLTIPDVGGTFQSFGDTEAFAWLEENAYKYGFILSYPEDNEFYIYEPWHWRFVGRDLARDLDRNDNRTFYTMDQREINKYLLEIFD